MLPRDRALVTAQWMCGSRISEILALTIADVCRPDDTLVGKIGFRPSYLKGGYGTTRWVPMSPELARALGSYLSWLRLRMVLTPKLPLFVSRQDFPDGEARAITRETARQVVRAAFAKAGIEDDGRLGTHSLRKTWAKSVWDHSGKDILVVKAALNHSDISITQKYLSVDDSAVEAAMRKVDFTRPTRLERVQRTTVPEPEKDLSGGEGEEVPMAGLEGKPVKRPASPAPVVEFPAVAEFGAIPPVQLALFA